MKKITLGIISPSFGPGQYYKDVIKRCVDNANKLGFKVKFMKYSLNSNGYISDRDKNRANDLMEAFVDNEVDIVMTMVGGNHSAQILKYLDFDLIKKNKKPFIGYSDITVLHHALCKKSKVPVYYGPAFITQFLRIGGYFDYTFEYFRKVVINQEVEIEIQPSEYWTDDFVDWGDKNQRDKKFVKNSGRRWLKKGKIRGELVGGCVPSINHLFGTKYLLDFENKIFFLDIPEDFCGPDLPLSISLLDAYLADFDNIGIFEKIKGLIIGRPYRYSQEQIEQMEEIILKYTIGKTYPILSGFDIGHTDPMLTLPFGASIEIDSDKNYGILRHK